MNKKIWVVTAGFCLAIGSVWSEDPKSTVDLQRELEIVNQQMRSLIQEKMWSAEMGATMARIQEMNEQYASQLAAIPEIKQLDDQIKQLREQLHQLLSARLAAIERNKTPALAALEKQIVELHATISPLKDPSVESLVNRRRELVEAISAQPVAPITTETATSPAK